MNFIKLTHDVLNVDSITDKVTDETCGAVCIFVGTTRDNFDGKKVTKLEYEAYEPMAVSAIEKICSQIREKWPNIKHIVIYHRLGSVSIKEASIIVAISSPHRLAAFEATQYAMDNIKAFVPIWKKEYYSEDVSPEWKENKECQWSHTERK